MANHVSAQKRHRQSLKRNSRNRMIRSEVRSAIKAARDAATSGDANAKKLAVEAERILAKAAAKGILHKKNVSRRVSRLTSWVASHAKTA